MSTRPFHSSEDEVAALRGALGADGAPPRTLVIAAHPDDEVVGSGGHLIRLGPNALIVHVTDGSPANLSDAHAAGFATADDYARERREESLRALGLAGVPASNCWSLDVGDQRASFALVELARTLAGTIRETEPALVLTHSYEGGHPDHDAVAFGVAAARQLLGRERIAVPPIAEFTSYHRGPAGIETGRFLESRVVAIELPLSEPMQNVKRAMIDAFVTQQRVLAQFPVEAFERFRFAPAYDFFAPPHQGLLYYESFPWGVDGLKWRALARAATAELAG